MPFSGQIQHNSSEAERLAQAWRGFRRDEVLDELRGKPPLVAAALASVIADRLSEADADEFILALVRGSAE
jgi:hypothetical protein